MTNHGNATGPALSRVFWTQSIKAFILQLAVMFIATALALVPFINIVTGLFISLLTILYLPTMALVKLSKLLPPSDGLLDYLAGWLLGVLTYSLTWGALKTWLTRKTRLDSDSGHDSSLESAAR